MSFEGVSHAFDRPGGGRFAVLEGASLRCGPGELVTLVGPSGCGKSTLLRMAAGLLRPAEGTVRVGDEDVDGRPGLVAYMPQKDMLLPWRRALANATLGAEMAGSGREEAEAKAKALWVTFGLEGFERSWPGQLSGGMRQRLALLRTFLMPQGVLLLDEPLGALDALTRRQMHAWLQGVWLADRRTVLMVTHDVDEALLLSDRVYVMSARPGRIVEEVAVGLARPRGASVVTAAEFVEKKAQVLAALDRGMGSPGFPADGTGL